MVEGLEPPAGLPGEVADVWRERVAVMGDGAERRVGPEFEAYCAAIVRLRDARARIAEEELIVPDGKNAPVTHPAYAIERQASDDLRKWGDKFAPRDRSSRRRP